MTRRSSNPSTSSPLRFLMVWGGTLVLLSLMLTALAIWNLPALNDWQKARRRHEAMEGRLELEKGAIRALEGEREALVADLDALEKAAREEYLLLQEGEEVFVFQEKRSPSP